ncbi:MAG TPA: hypothetical protein VGM02_07230 [Acidobacteriaceae bacterium]
MTIARDFIDRLRVHASKKYLDWAENAPKFNAGLVSRLQFTRVEQRSDAQDFYQKTRPAEGTSFRFDRLILIDYFPIEDFDLLEDQLKSLFRDTRDFRTKLNELTDSAGALTSGGWGYFGSVSRDPSVIDLPPPLHGTKPDLASYVQHVSIWVSKVLPSLFGIAYEARMNAEATQILKSELDQTHLPRVVYSGLLPFPRTFRRSAHYDSEWVLKEKVADKLAAIRLELERSLVRRFQGPLARRLHSRPVLEALAIYVLENPAFESVQAAYDANRVWLDCIGSQSARMIDSFWNNDVSLQWKSIGRFDHEPSSLFSAFVRAQPDSPNAPVVRITELQITSLVRNVFPLIALLTVIENAERDIQKLRGLVYRTIARRKGFKRLAREIKLNDRTQLQQMILQRLRFEWKSSREFVKNKRTVELRDLSRTYGHETVTLGESFVNRIDWFLKRVHGHGAVISTLLADYLQRRNLIINYRLQRRLLWWTVIVTLLTAYGIVKDWQSVVHFRHIIERQLSRF